MILVLAITGSIDVHDGLPVIDVIKSFIKGAILPTLPNGLWSVTVESHFYLILPMLLSAFRRFRMAAFALLAIAIILRMALYAHFGEIQSLAYWTLIGRIDQFLLGIVAFRYSGLLSGKHAIAGIVAVGFAAFYWLFDYAGGFRKMETYPSQSLIWVFLPTVEGAAYAVLIAYYDRTFTPRNVGVSWLIGLAGGCSYSIYLLHFFFVFHAAAFIHRHVMDISNFYVAEAWALLCFLLVTPIAYLSFRFVEAPFLKYRAQYLRPPKATFGRILL